MELGTPGERFGEGPEVGGGEGNRGWVGPAVRAD